MNRDAIRLTFSLHRFELLALSVTTFVGIVAALFVAWRLDQLHMPPDCLYALGDAGSPPWCTALRNTFYDIAEGQGMPVLSALNFLPALCGVFLGVPVVGRELERGTARLAWALAPRRFGWYLGRLVPLLGALLFVSFLAGFAADRLVAAKYPGTDIGASFQSYGAHGPLVAAHALVGFVVGVALGALIGRELPTILVTTFALAAIFVAGEQIDNRLLRLEAVIKEEASVTPNDRWLDSRVRLPDGTLVGWDYFQPNDATGEFIVPDYPTMAVVVPGSKYGLAEARQLALVTAASVGTLAAAALVVGRRSPTG